LSANDEWKTKVLCLKIGADDYVTKTRESQRMIGAVRRAMRPRSNRRKRPVLPVRGKLSRGAALDEVLWNSPAWWLLAGQNPSHN